MEREIKFRGKDESGKWLYGNFVRYREDNDEQVTCIVGSRRNDVDACVEFIQVDDDTVGQFTGLYDKNGKEIYEGDILSIGEDMYVCEFVEGGFEFRDKRDNLLIVKSIVHHTEVIGNIYDNKDLL